MSHRELPVPDFPPPPPAPMPAVSLIVEIAAVDATLGRVVMERIAELRSYLRWCRAQPNPEVYADLAAEYAAERRALLRLVREARRRPERVALARGDHFARVVTVPDLGDTPLYFVDKR